MKFPRQCLNLNRKGRKMNRYDARIIAETISNEELQAMFDRAKNGIKDWTQTSHINRGITKGVAWNVLAKDFDVNKKYPDIAKRNMVREFGEYLPGTRKLRKPPKPDIPPQHQEPIFK